MVVIYIKKKINYTYGIRDERVQVIDAVNKSYILFWVPLHFNINISELFNHQTYFADDTAIIFSVET